MDHIGVTFVSFGCLWLISAAGTTMTCKFLGYLFGRNKPNIVRLQLGHWLKGIIYDVKQLGLVEMVK